MSSASSTSLGTNTGTHTEQSTAPETSTNYSCTACQTSFSNGQEQRIHMKTPWHIYNIKRRIVDLPSISQHVFETQIEEQPQTCKTPMKTRQESSSDEEDPRNVGDQSEWPFQCLFCSNIFASDDAGFATNLEHMYADHGMSVPDADMVIDMQSFIGYLATEIREWYECIYCGATKSSTLSIQSHMRDKGHCLINLDREPELLDFWKKPRHDTAEDLLQQEYPTNFSDTEIYLASGKVIGSRHATSMTKKKRDPALTSLASVPKPTESLSSSSLTVGRHPSSSRQLSRREEMGIVGVSALQRQALILAEKKAQRSEQVAQRAREWVLARGANTQKYDQVDTKMKMGKQNHKLQPR